MDKYLETTEEIFNQYQGYQNGVNAINIVQTVDGRYVTSANVKLDFPEIFDQEAEEFELTSEDFPQPEFTEILPGITTENTVVESVVEQEPAMTMAERLGK